MNIANRLKRITVGNWIVFLAGWLLLFNFARFASFQGWDESYFLTQLTSVFQDHDLLLQNNLVQLPNRVDILYRSILLIRPSGALPTAFPIGFALSHGFFSGGRLMTHPGNPFSDRRFRVIICLTSLMFLILTCLVQHELLKRLKFSPGLAATGAFLTVIATPLSLYGTRFYFNSHLLSVLYAGMFCLASLIWIRGFKWKHAVWTALSGGMLAINRWQDILILLGLVPAVMAALRYHRDRIPGLKAQIVTILLIISGILAIQFAVWRIIYGSWLLMPQGDGFMHWTHPQIGHLLFSGFNGLVPWMPGMALGLVFFPCLIRKVSTSLEKAWVWGMTGTMVAVIYISASPFDWWGGDSYGPRRLCSLIPVAIVGLTEALSRMRFKTRSLLIVFLFGWMLFTMGASQANMKDLRFLAFGTKSTDNEELKLPPTNSSDRFATLLRGIKFIIKPGFTFTETPDNSDRIFGFFVIGLLMGSVILLWRFILKQPGLQWAGLSITGIWLTLFLILFATAFPRNDTWNIAWKSLITGPDPKKSMKALPSNCQDSAALVLATRYILEKNPDGYLNEISQFDSKPNIGFNCHIIEMFTDDQRNLRVIGNFFKGAGWVPKKNLSGRN